MRGAWCAPLSVCAQGLDLEGVEQVGAGQVKMGVGLGILARFDGCLGGGLAGAVGVAPEAASDGRVLATADAIAQVAPLREGVERSGHQFGGVCGGQLFGPENGFGEGLQLGGSKGGITTRCIAKSRPNYRKKLYQLFGPNVPKKTSLKPV